MSSTTANNSKSFSIPISAAYRNLKISIIALAIGFLLAVCGCPSIVVSIVGAVFGGFLLTAIGCVLDVQEFKMRQNQEILFLLRKIVNNKKLELDNNNEEEN